jgi:hypothetical protein
MASIAFLTSSTTVIFSGDILNNNNIWRYDENYDQVDHDIIIIIIKILLILYCLFFDRCHSFKLHDVEIYLLACR